MKLATSFSVKSDTAEAVQEAFSQLSGQLPAQPNVIIAWCTADYDFDTLVGELNRLAPYTPCYGASSCQSVMTQQGYHNESGHSLALLGLYDPDGAYGVGACEMGGQPVQAAQQAVNAAIDQADRPGELPAMILVTAAPGSEERLIEGIQEIVGPQVPIIGGTSADNEIAGAWHQFTHQGHYQDAVVVAVMYPTTEVYFAFHSGYEPSTLKGKVTAAEGRQLQAIDGRPAAEVYNEWTEGVLGDSLTEGGDVLGKTTLHPLGRIAGKIGEIPFFKLSHPESVLPEGALSLFTEIAPGEEIFLMRGTQQSLISRAGRVAHSALQDSDTHDGELAGALVFYCAGCMLTVGNDMPQVVESLNEALDEKPFLGTFTFGEQGCFPGGDNHHGNLMISVLAFVE